MKKQENAPSVTQDMEWLMEYKDNVLEKLIVTHIAKGETIMV